MTLSSRSKKQLVPKVYSTYTSHAWKRLIGISVAVVLSSIFSLMQATTTAPSSSPLPFVQQPRVVFCLAEAEAEEQTHDSYLGQDGTSNQPQAAAAAAAASRKSLRSLQEDDAADDTNDAHDAQETDFFLEQPLKSKPDSTVVEGTKAGDAHRRNRRNLYLQNAEDIWGIDRIDQPTGKNGAYSYDFQGEGVVVYVVDTGVDSSHDDFEDRLERGFSVHPRWLYATFGDSDPNGHGTHVASTIAGKVYGVAKKATIVPVRAIDSRGMGSATSIAGGIRWAVDHASRSNNNNKRNIINLSVDSSFNSDTDRAIDLAHRAGFIVVGAAGNRGEDACERSPASNEHAITVGAVKVFEEGDGVASFSNWGKCIDVFAPGADIRGAEANDDDSDAYQEISGTSMASPHVAGIAALLWSKYPDWTNDQIRQRLMEISVHDAVSFEPACELCDGYTTKRLAQVPHVATLVTSSSSNSGESSVPEDDIEFMHMSFGPSINFSPRVTSAQITELHVGHVRVESSVKGSNEQRTCGFSFKQPVVTENFALVKIPDCVAPYEIALRLQDAGANVAIIESDRCHHSKWQGRSAPKGEKVDRVHIPTICVSSENGQKLRKDKVSASLGLSSSENKFLQTTTESQVWSYQADGYKLDEKFQEWRADWNVDALGQESHNMCLQFVARNDAEKMGRANPRLLFALSSKPLLSLTREQSPRNRNNNNNNPSENWYAFFVAHNRAIILTRNGKEIAQRRSAGLNLRAGHTFFVSVYREGAYGASNNLKLTLGRIDSAGNRVQITTFQDPDPLPNVNFFSFSAHENVVMDYQDIKACTAVSTPKPTFSPTPMSEENPDRDAEPEEPSSPLSPPQHDSKQPRPTEAPTGAGKDTTPDVSMNMCSKKSSKGSCQKSGCIWYDHLPRHWANCRPECHFPGNQKNCNARAGCQWENGDCVAVSRTAYQSNKSETTADQSKKSETRALRGN